MASFGSKIFPNGPWRVPRGRLPRCAGGQARQGRRPARRRRRSERALFGSPRRPLRFVAVTTSLDADQITMLSPAPPEPEVTRTYAVDQYSNNYRGTFGLLGALWGL